VEVPYPTLEPFQEALAFSTVWQAENAILQLAQDNRVDQNVSLVLFEPVQHASQRLAACRFTEDVCIDEKSSHRVSVDSDAMGSNQSFSGQARSQSTSLWLSGSTIRVSR
jgi:hypothetical protein